MGVFNLDINAKGGVEAISVSVIPIKGDIYLI